jgi:ammonia channel protein AmtB
VLESGCVNPKNEVNIMVKNALDVVFGGISFWAFGFGLSFGSDEGTNAFTGVGCFFVDAAEDMMGDVFSVFLFQLSFATTATTIVSGAMAERARLHAYLAFCIVNTFTFSIVAHWMWSETGFLHRMGAIDAAGCGPVHLVGGVTGLVATVMLKPRSGTFDLKEKPTLPSPLKALLGMFMLWWVYGVRDANVPP